MKEIKLNLTVDEVNLLLEGLGELPFKRVFELVTKLQRQAADQIRSIEETETPNLEPELAEVLS